MELYGGIHKTRKKEDRLKDEIINLLGIHVIRFINEKVETDINEVIEQITKLL